LFDDLEFDEHQERASSQPARDQPSEGSPHTLRAWCQGACTNHQPALAGRAHCQTLPAHAASLPLQSGINLAARRGILVFTTRSFSVFTIIPCGIHFATRTADAAPRPSKSRPMTICHRRAGAGLVSPLLPCASLTGHDMLLHLISSHPTT